MKLVITTLTLALICMISALVLIIKAMHVQQIIYFNWSVLAFLFACMFGAVYIYASGRIEEQKEKERV